MLRPIRLFPADRGHSRRRLRVAKYQSNPPPTTTSSATTFPIYSRARLKSCFAVRHDRLRANEAFGTSRTRSGRLTVASMSTDVLTRHKFLDADSQESDLRLSVARIGVGPTCA